MPISSQPTPPTRRPGPAIDPIVSLAFSIHAAPKRYALLLGSGLSTGAGIPTGWQITLDLVNRLAAVSGETPGDDPEAWYRDRYGESPSYSRLLDELAKGSDDRQSILRAYIEPDGEEAESGDKQPTAAHNAIASLVHDGFINVIITTNFDRLLERALSDAGVEPVVLSASDQVQGALPPHHTQCTILKLHGDYLNSPIRNTEDELAQYPEPVDKFLDRIIDDYGLVICGWSGEWDSALREAIFRAPSRRFTTYWTSIDEPSDKAKDLIRHRDATRITINDADTFFRTLADRVMALTEFTPPHPASTDAAVAVLKRYLSESRFNIQLSDFIRAEVDDVAERTSVDHFPVARSTSPDSSAIRERLDAYAAATGTLVSLAMVAGAWGEAEHARMWRDALVHLGAQPQRDGLVVYLDLQRIPATLLLYALGLGAVYADRLPFLASILDTSLPRLPGDDLSVRWRAATVLPPYMLSLKEPIHGYENRAFRLSHWLHDRLQPRAHELTRDSDIYTGMFDKLEILVALNSAHRPPDPRFDKDEFILLGAFVLRQENRERIVSEIEESLSLHGDESPYVTSGVFGGSRSECSSVLEAFKRKTRSSTRWDG